MVGLRESLTTALLLAVVSTASCGDSSEANSARVPDDSWDAGAETDAGAERDATADSAEGSSNDGEVDGSVAPEDAQADNPADTASPGDAGLDMGTDAGTSDGEPSDGSPDAVSQFCGDSIRDQVTEECDDGPGDGEDSCTASCRVHSYPVVSLPPDAAPEPTRSLGAGRHVAAAGGGGFGVIYTQADAIPTVRLQRFDERGQRRGVPVDVAAGARPTGAANPVVTALPGSDHYAVAWTDGSGGTPDVALRLVAGGSVPVGVPMIVHGSVAGPQQDPDVLWTGNEFVVAWSDLSSVKYRRFNQALAASDIERTLSGGSQFAGNVALAGFGNGWAAAWRAGNQGLETIGVRVGDSSWNTRAFLPAFEGDHPALVELDSTHLLLFYTSGGDVSDAGSATGSRLRIAIVDVAVNETLESTVILPTTPPHDQDASLRQRRPAAARVGDRLFITWETESPLGDPQRSELWLAELAWSASSPRVVQKLTEWPVPAGAIRSGDQKSPALAASTLFPSGALIRLWEDHSRQLAGRPAPDLMLDFRPVPFVSIIDGG